MNAPSALPGAVIGVTADLAPLTTSQAVIIAVPLAFIAGFFAALLLNRLAVRRLGRTATALAAHAAEILEETANQTWTAQRTAAATATAAQRLESVIDGATEDSAARLERIAGRARTLEGPEASELATSIQGVARRLQAVTQVRDAGLAGIESSLDKVEGMIKGTAKSTRRLERVARTLNQRGFSLLRFARRPPFRWTLRPSATSQAPGLQSASEPGS